MEFEPFANQIALSLDALKLNSLQNYPSYYILLVKSSQFPGEKVSSRLYNTVLSCNRIYLTPWRVSMY